MDDTTETTSRRRHVGLVGAVLAMAAGTAGAIAVLGAPPSEAGTPATPATPAMQRVIVRPVDSHRHAASDLGILCCGSSDRQANGHRHPVAHACHVGTTS